MKLQVFINSQFKVRTLLKDGEPWFVAKDVCEILALKNVSEALVEIDINDKSNITGSEVGNDNSKLRIINESGLYSLIFKSRKPEAKDFQKWVTKEVLPSVRKHGAYMTPETLEKAMLSPDFIIELAGRLKEEQEIENLGNITERIFALSDYVDAKGEKRPCYIKRRFKDE